MPERFIDNFSSQSTQYYFSRPRYPELLFEFLYTVTSQKKVARDCETRNGQTAIGLNE